MQYLLLPLQEQELYRLLDRAVEPEYGPTLAVSTAGGLRLLPYGEIEYLECTHHVVHFHLSSGEDVASLSLRVPFSEVARPLLEDGRFLQPHRSYVVNLARVERVCADEMQMRTGELAQTFARENENRPPKEAASLPWEADFCALLGGASPPKARGTALVFAPISPQ